MTISQPAVTSSSQPQHAFTIHLSLAFSHPEAEHADIDTKISAQAADEDRRAHVHSEMSRLAELSTHLQSELNDADWPSNVISAPLFSI